MPRKPREEVEPGIHHVYARGNNRERLFRTAQDGELYLELLAKAVKRARWRLLSYCLMPNHLHLLVETVEPTLGKGMHRLHGAYAQRFNAAHGRSGHVFQGRYGSVPVVDDAQLLTTIGYVAANPVAAGLCRRPEHWRWSSHAATLDATQPRWLDAPRLLEHVGAWGGDARRSYAQLVDARLAPS